MGRPCIVGEGPNPSGLCMCGCGGRTGIAPQTDAVKGWVFGQPKSFIANHHQRYHARIQREHREWYSVDESTGCWNWMLPMRRDGYGRLTVEGRRFIAHRYMYEAACGTVPDGFDLHHTCGNKSCVNPAHLVPLSRRDHVLADRARLSDNDLCAIRARCANGEMQKNVAADYGVHPSHVSRIVSGDAPSFGPRREKK